MPTVDIPAQRIDPTGVAAGVKRFRADMADAGVRGFDWPLLGAVLGLSLASLFVLNAATRDDIPGSPDYYVIRQGVFVAIGLGLMFAVSRIDYTRLREYRTPIYLFVLASNALVLLVGSVTNGSRSWIDIGFFRIQPSELGKVLMIVVLGAFITDRLRDRSATTSIVLPVLGLVSLPMVLVFLQPDLGTALVYGAITLAMLFIAGIPWQQMTALVAVLVLLVTCVLWAAPAAGVNILQPYQVERLTSFIDPEGDPSGDGYQQNQAQIAIGAGQRVGRGVEASTQTQLNFLPEHHTDFVFAVIGESYGFAGAALVLTLYALLLWRALRILASARDQFGALIATGVVAMLMFQLFENVGMNVGIMPITGVTLPLLSYGGASVIATFIALGLLQSVAVRSRGDGSFAL